MVELNNYMYDTRSSFFTRKLYWLNDDVRGPNWHYTLLFSGTYVILWRRGSMVITAANLMIIRDSRFRLVDGFNLEISNVMPQDAGDYVCQISYDENRDLIHTVEILGKAFLFFLIILDTCSNNGLNLLQFQFKNFLKIL